MDSPAAAYALSRRRAKFPQTVAFADEFDFPLDPFQVEACEALEDGHGVLVCAPTGAGKTVVGEFAVHLALARGQGCAYTTPIKALSNQKYADLVARYGADRVGLLTGDNSINPNAPILVMTTEVLRNMLYVGSQTIDQLGFVVMDEVHYLADRFRGAVWEEVIIHLPQRVQLASLSATVSNAEEFGQWLQSVRGDTRIVVTEDRPVPLWQHMILGNRMYDLLTERRSGDSRVAKAVNPELQRVAREHANRAAAWNKGARAWRPPRRTDVVERLDRAGLLPAIYFIFSRAGCDAAVAQCLRTGVRLLDEDERAEVRSVARRRTAELSDADLQVLGFWEWLDALEHGYAAHHAGMIPVFKETVEELFVRGLCRVVFATETLALGINMPARSVVLERLVKFNGETHERLTPGEYTQLTGRAGRRGIDVEGHAVTLWGPDINPSEVASLATTRTFPLRSSFRPSYNMAVNLAGSIGRTKAKALLEQSFAQYQADRAVIGLVKARDEARKEATGRRDTVTCERGSVEEYADLLRKISDIEKGAVRERAADRRDATLSTLGNLRRGDIIRISSGKHRGFAVVLEKLGDTADPRLMVLTADRWSGRIDPQAFHGAVEVLARIKIPKSFSHRTAQSRREMATRVRSATDGLPRHAERKKVAFRDDDELRALRSLVRAHPVHDCPERDKHVRDYEDGAQAARAATRLADKVDRQTGSLGRTFDAVCDVLVELGYLPPPGQNDTGQSGTTSAGRLLSRIWSEGDLLIAECLREGVWSALTPADLAAVVSTVVYESRQGTTFHTQTTPMGSKRVRAAVGQMQEIWRRLETITTERRAPVVRGLDAGFALAAYRWASGDQLSVVLENLARAGFEISPGDFVRWTRQVIDVLEQLARLTGEIEPQLIDAARQAIAGMRRGVLADPTRLDPDVSEADAFNDGEYVLNDE